jgi:hypothetical protein
MGRTGTKAGLSNIPPKGDAAGGVRCQVAPLQRACTQASMASALAAASPPATRTYRPCGNLISVNHWTALPPQSSMQPEKRPSTPESSQPQAAGQWTGRRLPRPIQRSRKKYRAFNELRQRFGAVRRHHDGGEAGSSIGKKAPNPRHAYGLGACGFGGYAFEMGNVHERPNAIVRPCVVALAGYPASYLIEERPDPTYFDGSA